MTHVDKSDLPIKLLTLSELNGLDYVIVGDGEYVNKLVKSLSEMGVTKPSSILVTSKRDYLTSCYQMIDDNDSVIEAEYVVLGTGTFKAEMVSRLAPRCKNVEAFLDVNLYNSAYCQPIPSTPLNESYVLFVDTHPQKVISEYLETFFEQLEARGIRVIAHNPLTEFPNWYLTDAKALLVWNGSRPTFSRFVHQTKQLGLDITYAECGFFPQKEYFYLDKCGVNARSQLYDDDLSWVGAKELDALFRKRQLLKNKLPKPEPGNYILAPLQVPDDSNILIHSSFTNGMQEFIDYILQRYPGEKVVFKVHPKDHTQTGYNFGGGSCSNKDTLSLSLNAKLVHGINSSVLYEAALLGVRVIAEGDCLLKQHAKRVDTLLAAMIYRQFDVQNCTLSSDKLSRFSHIKIGS